MKNTAKHFITWNWKFGLLETEKKQQQKNWCYKTYILLQYIIRMQSGLVTSSSNIINCWYVPVQKIF